MRRIILFSMLLCLVTYTVNAQRPAPDKIETGIGTLTVQPIQHGTLALNWNGNSIYVDPTGGTEAFEGLEAPDLILITDIHGDHLDVQTLESLKTKDAVIVAPQAVADQLPDRFNDQLTVVGNNEETEQLGISIRAIPMYNLPESKDAYHPKGRGNGYILTMGGKKVYISGDTEGIPEMRSLKNIDVAFLSMNLPYTMNVKQAADAVLDFQPDIVYPYHYRGQDTEKFKQLVTEKSGKVEVRLRDWYPGD